MHLLILNKVLTLYLLISRFTSVCCSVTIRVFQFFILILTFLQGEKDGRDESNAA